MTTVGQPKDILENVVTLRLTSDLNGSRLAKPTVSASQSLRIFKVLILKMRYLVLYQLPPMR